MRRTRTRGVKLGEDGKNVHEYIGSGGTMWVKMWSRDVQRWCGSHTPPSRPALGFGARPMEPTNGDVSPSPAPYVHPTVHLPRAKTLADNPI